MEFWKKKETHIAKVFASSDKIRIIGIRISSDNLGERGGSGAVELVVLERSGVRQPIGVRVGGRRRGRKPIDGVEYVIECAKGY